MILIMIMIMMIDGDCVEDNCDDDDDDDKVILRIDGDNYDYDDEGDNTIFVIVFRASLHKMERRSQTTQPICIIHVSMESAMFNDHHGTPTAFLTNFTKTVKLTETPIACHCRR